MTFPVSTSHNVTAPSFPPLTIFFPSGDNAIAYTALSPSRQSFPICCSLCKSHTRSEPSLEQVIIRCPPGRCMASRTSWVCPSNFPQGLITRVTCVTPAGKDIVLRLSQHCQLSSATIYAITHQERRLLGSDVRNTL